MVGTAIEKKERPIIFGAESIKAILEGRKTMTRRIIKPQPYEGNEKFATKSCFCWWHKQGKDLRDRWRSLDDFKTAMQPLCPYGKVGDLLYVKENWSYRGSVSTSDDTYFNKVGYADGTKRDVEFTDFNEMMDAAPQQRLKYPSDYDELSEDEKIEVKNELLRKWWKKQDKKSARFMPRWASRITLEITNIRVERLQDISESDAEKEGVEHLGRPGIDVDIDGNVWNGAYKHAFANLWNKINGADSWQSNPFVWVVEFKKI